MRVFSTNTKLAYNGQKSLQSINCSLSADDISVIKAGVSALKKSDNEVIESVKKDILFNLENL